MKIVLDTNVLVSGLLSPFGPPARILQLLISEALIICYDARIMAEYRDVLGRSKFGFDQNAVQCLLDFLGQNGEAVASVPLSESLPDKDDEIFLEAAISGKADALVTGNLLHFPKHLCGGVKILSPADFLLYFKKKK